jgi:hypothetical protein
MSELASKIGNLVTFGPQEDIKAEPDGSGWTGKIIDEVWATPDLNKAPPHPTPCPNGTLCEGDYSFCGQLIKWDDAKYTPHKTNVRLAYYRRRCGEDIWRFGSQTTVCSDPPTVYALLSRTLIKNDWFGVPKANGSN